jgi:hypothetical protein
MARRLVRFLLPKRALKNVLLKGTFQAYRGATTRDSLAAAPRRLLKLDEFPDAFTR